VLRGAGGGAGVQLSAGQEQLLTLTRALVSRPSVLLFDEATSYLDGASEAALREALRSTVLNRGTAVLTVALRLATAREAHRVIVMRRGLQVAEFAKKDAHAEAILAAASGLGGADFATAGSTPDMVSDRVLGAVQSALT
jgi:ABC-type bacteriocin/lantibiotic exporter with double-glycine peptidase domain